MKSVFFKFLIVLVLPLNSFAMDACTILFEEEGVFKPEETQTSDKEGRYFKVNGYKHFLDSELDHFLKEIKNMVQFSDKRNLKELFEFMPPTSGIPADAFFVANQIIPIIEVFLNKHHIKYEIKSYDIDGIPSNKKIKRSLIVISENGISDLNAIAADIGKHQRVQLVINPIDLFYRLKHYSQSRGRPDEVPFTKKYLTPVYSISFHLLLHSVLPGFTLSDMKKRDNELFEWSKENIDESIRHAVPSAVESKEVVDESQQRTAAIIQRMLDDVRKKKEDEQNKKGSD